jgi:hypothetical protein
MENQITPKREIKLNPNVTEAIKKLIEEVKPFQEKVTAINEKLTTIITTLCLNEGVDSATEAIQISEGFDTIYVIDNPNSNVVDEISTPDVEFEEDV